MRFLAAVVIAGLFTGPGHAAEPCPHKTPADALMASQELVRDKLKAPSTARFPRYPLEGNKHHVLHLSGCTFSILSYVDAENAFSAMLRERYAATMEYDVAADQWTGLLTWVPSDF